MADYETSTGRIESSAAYQRLGDFEKAVVDWAKANPGRADVLANWLANLPKEVPTVGTLMGDGIAGLVDGLRDTVLMAAADPPPPPVPPTQERPGINGAVLDHAANANPELLRGANVGWVAVEDTPENLDDFSNRGTGQRWGGFSRYGLFHVSHGAPTQAEIDGIKNLVTLHRLSFVIVDTEHHKTDLPNVGAQGRQWTADLYRMLRAALPRPFFLADVTFGINQDLNVVNHDVKRALLDSAIFETYDGDGVTLGVLPTVTKVNGQGWKPADVMYGTKSLEAEMPYTAPMRAVGSIRDAWLWAADHGPAQESLARGVRF